jgi:hypothetical protein
MAANLCCDSKALEIPENLQHSSEPECLCYTQFKQELIVELKSAIKINDIPKRETMRWEPG